MGNENANSTESVALDRHYSVAEVAERWNVSRDTVRRIFGDLPGVLKVGHRETRHKRKYVTLSIPERIVKAQHASGSREIDYRSPYGNDFNRSKGKPRWSRRKP